MAIRDTVAGKEDLGVPGELQRLAVLYAEQNRFAEAEPVSKRALAILEKEFGQNNSVRTLPILDNYANVLRKLGHLEEAQTLETRAQAIRAKDRSLNRIFLQNSPNQQASNQEIPNQQQLPIEVSPNQR